MSRPEIAFTALILNFFENQNLVSMMGESMQMNRTQDGVSHAVYKGLNILSCP